MRQDNISIRSLALAAALGLGVLATSCSDDNTPDDSRHWSENGGLTAADDLLFEGNVIGNGDQEFVFTGKQTLPKGTYLLKGWVYVADGAQLTLEPGTVIKGDKQTKAALIVERGGQIFAQGTQDEPIVFTSEEAPGSRKPGDWGGLILCGKAPNNVTEQQIEGGPRTKHGGTDANDNSGVLSYVRVEFAGYPFEQDKEINGITFGSVGRGTKIDHLQVSYSNDDSFEWFGGNVDCKYLVAYRGWDDDFDTDNGFSGHVQYGFAVRDPRIADTSQSNGFESDNNADGALVEPYTSAVFSNMTFIGPIGQDPAFTNDASYINGGSVYPGNGSALGRFQAAMQLRRASRLNCFNSLAVGFPIGIMLDNQKGNTQEAASQGLLKLQNVWMADMGILGSDANKLYKDSLVTGYDSAGNPIVDPTQRSFSSRFFLGAGNREVASSELLLGGSGLFEGLGVNFLPQSGSPLIGAASFSDPLLSTGFDRVNYVGAFGSTADWLQGWTEFDPQNAAY